MYQTTEGILMEYQIYEKFIELKNLEKEYQQYKKKIIRKKIVPEAQEPQEPQEPQVQIAPADATAVKKIIRKKK